MLRFFDDGAAGGRRQRWVRLAFIWGVWALVGLFFSSQIYVYFARTQRAVPIWRALAWQMTATLVFALSTPMVLWLARRYPFGRAGWRRALAAHLIVGTSICVVWGACHIVLDAASGGNLQTFDFSNLPRVIFYYLDKELLVYWIIVVVSHAVDYYQRYREGELRASQAQLHALKMQLHPHFLFNALHSISALVHSDPEAADKMIARLGDFLRLTLDTAAAQEVPLSQEIEFLNCYLEIERIRFRDRLTTRLDVDPRTLECRVPNLILQPIVENAIRHGVAPRSAPGRVEVRAERRGDSLRLQVKDNGRGLPETAVCPTKGGGVGLSNTRERLRQLYGGAFVFEIENDPEGGAIVTLEIPFRAPERASEEAARPAASVRGASTRPALQ